MLGRINADMLNYGCKELCTGGAELWEISELWMSFKRNVKSYKGFSVLGKIRADF